jgi:hypothetical protein
LFGSQFQVRFLLPLPLPLAVPVDPPPLPTLPRRLARWHSQHLQPHVQFNV